MFVCFRSEWSWNKNDDLIPSVCSSEFEVRIFERDRSAGPIPFGMPHMVRHQDGCGRGRSRTGSNTRTDVGKSRIWSGIRMREERESHRIQHQDGCGGVAYDLASRWVEKGSHMVRHQDGCGRGGRREGGEGEHTIKGITERFRFSVRIKMLMV